MSNAIAQHTDLSFLLHKLFSNHLVQERRLSKNTVSSCRDTLKLYLSFLAEKAHCPMTLLTLSNIDAVSINDFLQYLETTRNNSVRTRNNRLAAIRTFLNFAVVELSDNFLEISKILAIPQKPWNRPLLGYLEREEVYALINATDMCSWSSERDHTMLLLFYNTGARVSEVTHLQRKDADIHRQLAVHLYGKGRKERVIPLWSKTIKRFKSWLKKIPSKDSTALFSNRFGEPLTRSGVRQRLLVAQQKASKLCPSLGARKITPHTLRHTSTWKPI